MNTRKEHLVATVPTTKPIIAERLAVTRRELEVAEAEELRLFAAVSDGREALALEQITRRQFLSLQRDLAAAEDGVEGLRAKCRALERLQVQQGEADAAEAVRTRQERDREIRRRGVELEGRIGQAAARIVEELDSLAGEARAHAAESNAWQPATAAGRSAAFEAATTAARALARVYPTAR